MDFVPHLRCKSCPTHIWLPLPIQDRKTPRQIAWPWGALSGNFRCQSCGRVSLYWAEDCHWQRLIDTNPPGTKNSLVVHRISVPCGIEQCAGLLHILAVMPVWSRVEDGTNLAARTDLNGIPCDKEHPNHGRPVHGAIQCTAISVSKQ